MSMTKRYLTSARSIRSQAWLMSCMEIISQSGWMSWAAQKSSSSCVSAMPPMAEPASTLLPPSSRPEWKLGSASMAPTMTSAPSGRSSRT